MIKPKFKRHFISIIAITLMLITLISPLNIAHAATIVTSSDGNYKYEELADGTIKITNYLGEGSKLGSSFNLSIPDKIDGKTVTVIGQSAFAYMYLNSVTIPDSVTTLEENAFVVNKLTSVVIGNGVVDIGDYAFKSNNISYLKLGNKVKNIGNYAFSANKLTNVTFPSSLNKIGDYAFTSNSLSSITIPNNVTNVGSYAFSNNGLSSVVIPTSVTNIGKQAFAFNKITKFTVKNSNTLYGSDILWANPTGDVNSVPSNVTIYGNSGSTFEAYAKANGHTFVSFTNEESATYAVEQAESTLSQSDVDMARSLVNALPSGTVKDDLKSRLDNVQNKINQKQALANATLAVEQAESSKNSSDIITAQGLINALEDSTEKTNLQNRLDAVQQAVNQKQAETDATNAVEKAEASHSQSDLDTAKNLVNALPSGTVKGDLQSRIDAVQTIIDSNNQDVHQKELDATSAVEQAESSLNQTDLNNAKNLVNALSDGTVKNNLLNRIDTVQQAIDGANTGGDTETGNSTVTNDVNFKLDGGELSLKNSDVVSFGKVQLSDQPKSFSTSFTDHFTVKDLTGNQAGYRVDVSATPFTDGKNYLPKGTLSLKPVSSIERVGVGAGASPVSILNTNQIIDNGKVTLVSATEGTGMGVFDLTFPKDALSITVDPTTAKIDGASSTYQSTITWDLIQAP